MLVAQARTCFFFVLEIDDENYRSKADGVRFERQKLGVLFIH